ncbi:MAG: STAS/SEC14 domain-containing protein [Deltaproteobacteria bacterium]|nr:STAS/SEC14 domain-containing protein [Deltaproteobacteria bacterium]
MTMSVGFSAVQAEGSRAKVVTITCTGKLDQSDYELFVPRLEEVIKEGKPVRILMELRDFQGWTVGALWEDTKFGVRHFNDIDRLAVVGDRKWEKGLAIFAKPFTTAEVRFFDVAEMDQAREWLEQP